MFHATWTTPHKGPVTELRLTRDPHRGGLGIYLDENGDRWDVHGLLGGRRVWARRCSDAPSYYSTAIGSTTDGFHTWIPYDVTVVEPRAGS